MRQKISEQHRTDENGNPTGGATTGVGILIDWQNGPLGRGAERKEPNGAFVEGVIQAAIGRLEFYEKAGDGKFACEANKLALYHLEQALGCLDARTAEREARKVEGTHTA